jgi:ParB-like chromosome segregation protein Spo0J
MKAKLAVTYRRVDALIPYVGNSRTHSDEQVAQIAASIREFGFTNPILTDGDNGIIAGHGRLMAARKLAMDEVPTIELAGLTDAQKRAYVIADNKLALNAGWDIETLKAEFNELDAAGFDLELTGFGVGELTNLFLAREDGETDPNAEWEGMPEFDQPDAQSFRKVIVHFATQADVEDFERIIGQDLKDKVKSIWHPEAEIGRYADKRYA